jgi:hypothetical protein
VVWTNQEFLPMQNRRVEIVLIVRNKCSTRYEIDRESPVERRMWVLIKTRIREERNARGVGPKLDYVVLVADPMESREAIEKGAHNLDLASGRVSMNVHSSGKALAIRHPLHHRLEFSPVDLHHALSI